MYFFYYYHVLSVSLRGTLDTCFPLFYSWKIWSIEPFAQSHTESGVKASISQIHNFLSSVLTTVEDFIFCITMHIPVKIVYSKRIFV